MPLLQDSAFVSSAAAVAQLEQRCAGNMGGLRGGAGYARRSVAAGSLNPVGVPLWAKGQ